MQIPHGSTGVSIYFLIKSIHNAPFTSLAHNSPSIKAAYVREQGAAVVISLVALPSATAAHSPGQFGQVHSGNMKGMYRLDVPDAAFATGTPRHVVVEITGSEDVQPVAETVQLT